jgi:sec-independent protein translocase protein TatB
VLGVSFSEIVLIAVVALIVVGPRRLPEILGTLGKWLARLRRMTTEVRKQTGIDDILREEGISGGINELRSIMRGDHLSTYNRLPAASVTAAAQNPSAPVDAYGEAVDYDRLRERPVEGPDSYGAIPEDLLAGAAPIPPDPVPVPVPVPVPDETPALAATAPAADLPYQSLPTTEAKGSA